MADEQEHSGNNPKESMNPASEEGSGQSSGEEPTDHLEQVDPGKCEAPKFSEDKDPIVRGLGIQGGDGGNIELGPIGPRGNMTGETVTQTRSTGIQGGAGGDGPRRNMFNWFSKNLLDYMHSEETSKCFSNNRKALGQVHTSSTSKNAGESMPIKEEWRKQENREPNIHDTDTQGEERRDIVPGQGTEKDSVTRPASGDGGDNSSRGCRENAVLQATDYIRDNPTPAEARKRDGRFKAVKTFKQINDAPAFGQFFTSSTSKNACEYMPIKEEGCKQENVVLQAFAKKKYLYSMLANYKRDEQFEADYKSCKVRGMCFLCVERMMCCNVPCQCSVWCYNCLEWALDQIRMKPGHPHLCILCDKEVETCEEINNAPAPARNIYNIGAIIQQPSKQRGKQRRNNIEKKVNKEIKEEED